MSPFLRALASPRAVRVLAAWLRAPEATAAQEERAEGEWLRRQAVRALHALLCLEDQEGHEVASVRARAALDILEVRGRAVRGAG